MTARSAARTACTHHAGQVLAAGPMGPTYVDPYCTVWCMHGPYLGLSGTMLMRTPGGTGAGLHPVRVPNTVSVVYNIKPL